MSFTLSPSLGTNASAFCRPRREAGEARSPDRDRGRHDQIQKLDPDARRHQNAAAERTRGSAGALGGGVLVSSSVGIEFLYLIVAAPIAVGAASFSCLTARPAEGTCVRPQ